MSVGLEGLAAMQKTLNETKDSIVRRASKAGINAGLVPLVSAMRAAINASGASAAVKREARKTLAKRLKKSGGQSIGKAGFAVGKQSKAKRERAGKRSGDKTKRGVGISASNIHWFVLGTKERETKKGHGTGRIIDNLHGVIPSAAASAGPAMLEAARQKIDEVIAREVRKQAKKGASR